MKERPILFSAPMVRTILAGRKTQTRRVVKPVRGYEHNNICRPDMAADPGAVWWHGESERVGCLQVCPYGAPGDRLWVRETWAPADLWIDGYEKDDPEAVRYRADGASFFVGSRGPTSPPLDTRSWSEPKKWRPSIHMPRWASRITLEVTGVRIERLQDIGEEDAREEGVDEMACGHGHTLAFIDLWERINGAESWDANPWVWVVEFRRSAA